MSTHRPRRSPGDRRPSPQEARTIDGDGTDLTAAAWYYDDPFPAVAGVKDHVAFYADRVTVTATPSEPALR
jgi:hypothetical protein